MRSIIFDLDLTLIDTTCLEASRHSRNWQEAYNLIPQTTMYDGIKEVLDIIRKHKIKAAIVSTSPRPYVEKLIAYYDLPIQYIVSYHDAAYNTISFGDRVIDIQASNAADIESVACFWGTKEKKELLHSGYRHAIINPQEILTLIR